MLNKHQVILIFAAILLTVILYFGFGRVPKEAMNTKPSGENDKSEMVLLSAKEKARAELKKEQIDKLQILEKVLATTNNDSTKVETLKQLAAFWYEAGKAEVSGYYAEKVSDILNDKEALQITGTTYRIAIVSSKDENIKDICSQKASKAFEKAIAIDSSNVNYQMQLAMVFVDRPLQDNPMKGILMLRDLNAKYPDNVDVIVQLGKLAIQTGQFDKAIERFKKATVLSPETPSIFCLLAEAYNGKGDKANADLAIRNCKK